MTEKIKIGIIAISDRASAGIYEDLSGKAIEETISSYLISDWEKTYRLIPDEQALIEQTLIELSDKEKC